MQIQDSSTSTIKDDRRRSAHDAKRFALAVGNNQADAFAELFQVIATSKVGPEKAKSSIASDSGSQAAAPAKKSSDRAHEVAEQSEDDAPDEELDNSIAPSLVPFAAAVATQQADDSQPVADTEVNAKSNDTIAACHAIDPQSDSSAQPLPQLEQNDPSLKSLSDENLEAVRTKSMRERHGKDTDQVGSNQGSVNPEKIGKSVDSSGKAEQNDSGAEVKESRNPSHVQAQGNHETSSESTSAGANDDRRRDRGEILRDRLTGDDSKSQDAATPTASSTSDSSGSIPIDPSFEFTPTATPEMVPPTPTAEAINVVTAVAASVAVSSATTTTSAPTLGAASDGNAIVGVTTKNGSSGSLDDPASVSTMEQAPKSRQSEIADRARLIHRISKAFQKLGIDGGQVRLKMHPEDLGTVQLEMKISGNKVSASVTADNDAAARMLHEHLPELRQRLESQGLTVDRLQVEQRADSGSSSFNNQQSFQQQNEAFQEAARRQSQRNNYLTGSSNRASVASVSGASSSTTVSSVTGRYDGRLDINF